MPVLIVYYQSAMITYTRCNDPAWDWTGYPKQGTNRLAQPVSALTNWAMSTSNKMDGHNPEPITLDWLDTSESPPSPLPVHYVAYMFYSFL